VDHGRIVKKIFESTPEGRRRTARPTLRWSEDVEDDLRNMKVKRWRQKAVDRVEWASINKKAKTLRGPYCQGVSNKVSKCSTYHV
jgi:hypothetical protein